MLNVYLCTKNRLKLLTILPNVMSPTNALGGIRLNDIWRDS